MGLLIPDPIPVRLCSRCAQDAPLVNVFPGRNGGRPIEVYRCRACAQIEHVARNERRAAG
jgi:hypothetical protein